MPKSDLTESLWDVFGNVNEWLQFAELKNGALVTFDTAIAVGIWGFVSQYTGISAFTGYCIIAYSMIFILSAIAGILSFVPRVKILKSSGYHKNPSRSDNVIFFGEIASKSPDDYLNMVISKINYKDKPSPFDEELAQQIVINSKIASIKYRRFNFGVWLMLAGVITPIFALILYWGFVDEAL